MFSLRRTHRAEGVAFIRVETSLHAHAGLSIQLPKHQSANMPCHCKLIECHFSYRAQGLRLQREMSVDCSALQQGQALQKQELEIIYINTYFCAMIFMVFYCEHTSHQCGTGLQTWVDSGDPCVRLWWVGGALMPWVVLTCALWEVRDVLIREDCLVIQHISQTSQPRATDDGNPGLLGSTGT